MGWHADHNSWYLAWRSGIVRPGLMFRARRGAVALAAKIFHGGVTLQSRSLVCDARILNRGDESRDSRKPPPALPCSRGIAVSGSCVCPDFGNLFGRLGLGHLCDLAIYSGDVVVSSQGFALAHGSGGAVCSMAVGQNLSHGILSWTHSKQWKSTRRPRRIGLMCTLSVITDADGYLLAMNRDEKIARGAGEQAAIHERNGVRAIYPSEGADGTWIAVNEYGVAFGLLNWNDVVRAQPNGQTRSRGQIIPALASACGIAELHAGLSGLELEGIMPFRLIGVVPSEKSIGTWRWDSAQLTFHDHAWHAGHWFSSSLSDREAESMRGLACRDAQRELDAGSLSWLRRLHGSHSGAPGPFSLCVHRKEVNTLSYTEIVVTPETIKMGHLRGSPCSVGQVDPIAVDRVNCASVRLGDIYNQVS
jgi:hypothetical protein